ncbi:MAG: hypothetical protein UT11_C0013G0010 [Berkelbacteria bacterium GW2011_GWA2_38_9]|uniref:SWIM-type domain-containing protein n=1 Tax=Berkelbacteria bacterium GW2011_GWA2_38_9 TaxID=1618334 RepID=A0A0G0PL83_9BACT|nr:MAG: hypothetical protein UT11_C0013G0010 [Berkelbacteria bacterium GW2011_GWA2_38_9]
MKFNQSLTRYILDNTTEDIFWRGVDYVNKNKVDRIEESEKIISTTIIGSNEYLVEFRQGLKYLKGHCSCPYASMNEDYCKHIVALALAWDEKKGISPPDQKEVEKNCLQINYDFGKKVDQMFSDPLNADLKFLAIASDYVTSARPHAKIPIKTTITNAKEELSLKKVQLGLQKIENLTNNRNYDPYFCAGEISAVFCLTLDSIINKLTTVPKGFQIKIIIECTVFYYNQYLQIIDSSDGIHQIPFARLQKMANDYISRDQETEVAKILNQQIKGWGDVWKELSMK